MDFKLSTTEETFRDGLRDWLRRNSPGEWAKVRRRFASPAEETAFLRDWQRRLWEAGYVGLQWPREYGGQGASVMEQAIFYQEMAHARAPELLNVIGLDMAGPAIIAHGSESQKRAHLPRILAAERIFCQGFSEPDAGSDVAALKTRATREGDHFVLNGQKVWTSWAHIADWAIVLARTNPDVPKHRGLTMFLLDMRTPGISVRPLRQATGDAEFNEMFFDGVRIAADHVLGKVDGGWEVAITTLMFERGPRTVTRQLMLRHALDATTDLARERGAERDPRVRQRLAQLHVEAEALRLSTLRMLTRLARGTRPGPEGSGAKLYWSETWQRVLELMLELQGPYALLWQGAPHAIEDGYWQFRFIRSRGDTIAAGSSEINRNIVAERVLGLPKD